MPIYEFYCTKCNNEFELRRTMNEADKPARCPKCNARAEKLLSSCGLQMNNIVRVSPKFFRK